VHATDFLPSYINISHKNKIIKAPKNALRDIYKKVTFLVGTLEWIERVNENNVTAIIQQS
jgi:hypothetical protein